ncbi:Blue-light-activated protein [Gemmata sp. SH-PL17]|uniref:hybrid sensor histidine kinase/response regulator n=1 Tax=Gemmata sp. SH-PL17 TaxID=1630693 RepID=UPI00078DC9A3|nr:PAS domain-containing sensor histidine kinase [Gemmata sp. SH-PL17]AMV29539.1 Blue-light-activated protein [Gemmata sp. SH-PL17]
MPDSPNDTFRAIFDLLPTPVVGFDRDGRHTFVNPAGCRMVGRPLDQLLGLKVTEVGLPQEVAAEISANLERVCTSGEPLAHTLRFPAAIGPVTLLVNLTALPEGAGVLATATNITAQSHAEIALRESEERYRKVVEDQTEVVCRFRPDGTITFVNDVYCRMFGKRVEELIGHSWQPLVHPDDRAHIESELATMAPTKPVVRIENRLTDGAGRMRWMEFVNRGFYVPSGELVEVQAVGRDVTDRRAAEDARRELEADLRAREQQQKYDRQLLQSQKLESLGVLAGGIAHDFNNLLTAMLGYASLSRMRLPPNDPISEDLKRIESAAQRAAELCQQMLAYAGRGQFVVHPVDLNVLTQEMSQLLATALSKRAVLKYNLTIGLPSVQADPTQLRQIVMNLITNASDAIEPRSGVITLTTGLIDADARYLSEIQAAAELAPGRYVYLEVSDTGSGMTEDVQSKIFDPFFTTKFTGRGLGLAAVQGIVRAHRGAIKVYSQVGKGTTFKVLLPALDRPSETSVPVPAVPTMAGRGRRVLVVDDEEDVQVFTRKILELVGFVVTVARDGRAGVEAFAVEPGEFALVLLDLTMPRLGGAEAYREMRRLRGDVRVVLTSGFAAQEATSGFEGKGLAGFLRKPFRADELLKIVIDTVGP